MRASLSLSSAAALSLAAVSAAQATVLTFDYQGSNLTAPPPEYGDNVGKAGNVQPPWWVYGADGGLTPHVTVDYGPGLLLGGTDSPFDPTRVFGDLEEVLYRDRFGSTIQITLSAEPGWLVCLHYFDLAAVFNSVTGVGEDLPLKYVRVLTGGGVPLFSLDYDPAVLNRESLQSTYVPGTEPLRHKRFTWDANPLRASTIIIRLDLSQVLTIGGGTKLDRFGIDNIKFSEIPVPTPGAAGLIGLGALVATRRRRSARSH